MCKWSVGPRSNALRPSLIKRFGVWTAISIVVTAGTAAWGQTASDKATARQLATQGIQSYQQGKHAEALDLLQRAEQLYDAPVHLVYIARTQAALGKLVEASETYRRLVRTDLAAGAPQAFKDAVSDAQRELLQLEPKIPSLRIDVNPSDIKGLQLRVDGEVVSSVVIGINRPTNPGKHTIEAAAANYDTAMASVELAPSSKQAITLQMRARPGTPAPVAVGTGGTAALSPTIETGATTAAAGTSPQPAQVQPLQCHSTNHPKSSSACAAFWRLPVANCASVELTLNHS